MNNFDILKNFWKEILDKPSYDKWILPLKYIGTLDNIIYIGSPDINNYNWINENLKNKTADFKIKLVPLFEEDIIKKYDNNGYNNNTTFYNTRLQKRYTFDSFVQTDTNKLAYSFSFSVAEYPGESYNPLYIYSDVGLGKTHLIQAIGNRIISKNKNMKVVYLTTQDLMNEYVEYTRLNKRQEFIKKYTDIDVLLIDDIQYITQWEGTSQQFYYIFNNLIQQEKQIVLCSDTLPENIPNLEDRIKSRFQWGGVVEILHYSLEDRIAILKKKINEKEILKKQKFNIENEAIHYIASLIKDNIRNLEGALNRVIGYMELTFSDMEDAKIDIKFTKQALRDYIKFTKKKITIENIQEYISEKYKIKVSDLKSKNNSQKITLPRQIAMYLCKRLTDHPLTEIGEKFGGKHHTTVLHSIRKIENMLKQNQNFYKKVENFVEFFES